MKKLATFFITSTAIFLAGCKPLDLSPSPKSGKNKKSSSTAQSSIEAEEPISVGFVRDNSEANLPVDSQMPMRVEVELSKSAPHMVEVDYMVEGLPTSAGISSSQAGTILFYPGQKIAVITLMAENTRDMGMESLTAVIRLMPVNEAIVAKSIHLLRIRLGRRIAPPAANQAPVANAGADQKFIDSDGDGKYFVFLDASLSRDPDGELASYTWMENGAILGRGVRFGAFFTQGTHVVTLKVTDDKGLEAFDQTVVQIDPEAPLANQRPMANAGADQSLVDNDNNGIEMVSLNAIRSSDPDGQIVSYLWYYQGQLIGQGQNISFPLPVGSHLITLKVSDDQRADDEDQVLISIASGATPPPAPTPDPEPTNLAPIASAGPDSEVTDNDNNGGENVSLNGLGSRDPDGMIESYRWINRGAVIATDPVASVFLPIGEHFIQLIVTDDKGMQASDDLKVVVNQGTQPEPPSPPQPPPPAPMPELNLNVSDAWQNIKFGPATGNLVVEWELTFQNANVNGTVAVAAGEVDRYRDIAANIRFNDGAITVRDGDDYRALANIPLTGQTDYYLKLEVDIQSKRYSAFVGRGGQNPVMIAQNFAFRSGQSDVRAIEYITMRARESSMMVKSIRINGQDYRQNGDGGGAGDPPTPPTPEPPPAPGAPGNQAPVANAGPDQSLIDSDNNGVERANLNATLSRDSDGQIINYTWMRNGTPIGQGLFASVELPVGSHSISLVVEDDKGATDSDSVQISIGRGSSTNRLTFANDILPLMEASCTSCHSTNGRMSARLAVDTYEAANGGDVRERWVNILRRIANKTMPPAPRQAFSDQQIALIQRWIDEGLDEEQSGPAPDLCQTDSAPAARLWRLSHTQYKNTVRDLLDLEATVADSFPSSSSGTGYKNDAATAVVSATLASLYQQSAEQLALQAVARLGQYIRGERRSDVEGFIRDFGKKAFRGPLSATEQQDFYNLYVVGREESHLVGMQLMFEAFLQHPRFLYRYELGEGNSSSGAVELTAYEKASQLSYLIWDSMPDDQLLALADNNRLNDPQVLEAQVARMLEDPKSRGPMDKFFKDWLALDNLVSTEKNPQIAPNWNNQTKQSVANETTAFINHVIWNSSATLDELLKASYTFVDSNLIEIYGDDIISVNGPVTNGRMAQASLNPARRSGIFTQIGVLSVNATREHANTVNRGLLFRQNGLCQIVPEPPPNVDEVLKETGEIRTNRDRYAEHGSNPACISCHNLIDPLGFPFEHYDAIGRYQTTENGFPVNASSNVMGTDVDGPVANAIDLMGKFTQSRQFSDCFVTQYMRFATGRLESASDQCQISPIQKDFHDSGKNIKELIKKIVANRLFNARQRGGE